MKIHLGICSILIGLFSVSQIALAQDKNAPNPILKRHLETYDNPPVYIYRLETGPRMISPFGPFVSYQANVDANGNNIVGDAANECSIAVDPTNRNKMVIGWRQFNSVTSNFRQGGWGYTTDAGLTWHFPGVLENNVFRSDPVLDSDETGRFFYNSLLQSLCINIYRSINGGQSWTELQADGAGGSGDKQWFTIDRTNGIGHGFQYQAWDTSPCSGSGQFSRSTDGGVTWQATISLPSQIEFGTLDVDTNGNLFVGGEPGSGTGGFRCLRSSNAQNGGQTPTFDRITTVNLGGQLNGGGINPAGLTGQSFLAVDKSGGPTNNNVYMLASVTPTTQSTGTEVMFVRSTDGGQTFSAPVRVTDDPVVVGRWHWFGTFAVAPNGRLDAVWYDTRNGGNNINSQLFYSYSTDTGMTWAPNVAVSVRLILRRVTQTRARLAITSRLFPTTPEATSRIRRRLISTLAGISMKKTCITFTFSRRGQFRRALFRGRHTEGRGISMSIFRLAGCPGLNAAVAERLTITQSWSRLEMPSL